MNALKLRKEHAAFAVPTKPSVSPQHLGTGFCDPCVSSTRVTLGPAQLRKNSRILGQSETESNLPNKRGNRLVGSEVAEYRQVRDGAAHRHWKRP